MLLLVTRAVHWAGFLLGPLIQPFKIRVLKGAGSKWVGLKIDLINLEDDRVNKGLDKGSRRAIISIIKRAANLLSSATFL